MTVRRRVLLVSLLALASLFAALLELSWRAFHGSTGQVVAGPFPYSAEVRHLPENSALPYGYGVFIYNRLIPLRQASATLVFVGYCRNISLAWLADQTLQVTCTGSGVESRVIQSTWARFKVRPVLVPDGES